MRRRGAKAPDGSSSPSTPPVSRSSTSDSSEDRNFSFTSNSASFRAREAQLGGMPEDISDFNWHAMRFESDAAEEAYLAECFHYHYVAHQCIHVQGGLAFLLRLPASQISLGSKIWKASMLLIGLACTGWVRRSLHRIENRSRAARYGKWLTLGSACVCFAAEALFTRSPLPVFLAQLRWLQLAMFTLWMHTWALNMRERLALFSFVILCNTIQPPDQGMTKVEDVLVLLAVLTVSFLTSLVLENSQRISHRDRRMLLAHAQTERLGDSQLNHVIKNK